MDYSVIQNSREPKRELQSMGAVMEVKESETAMAGLEESTEATIGVKESISAAMDVKESMSAMIEINESESKEAVVDIKESQGAVMELKRQSSSSGGQGRDRDRESDSYLQHLQCPHCLLQCKSHCSYLIHIAKIHPSRLDDTPVGRLGNALFYQRTARLFHCSVCFHTAREFPRLYEHLLTCHCLSGKGEEGEGDERRGEGGEEQEGISVDVLSKDSSHPLSEPKAEEEDEDKGGAKKEGGRKRGLEEMEEGEDNEEDSRSAGSPMKRNRSSMAGSEEDDHDEEEEELQTNNNKKSDKHKKQEEAFLTKYIQRQGGRYNCRLCGKRSKMKGHAIHHVSYKHDVPKPYCCKECSKAFILEYSLLNHIYHNHRQGMYLCLFCPFSSDVVWGIKRHGNRCNARSGEEGEGSNGEE
ncbi:chromosome alignment-maintaining phosphoprotein 1 isoform X1 [Oncorhynchus tshawytscha]|uniref:chromosome alignment-maintaining phosphoprotein 1 isoform X1 n=2 Tax=Oncorhynchus tshawytscha TaxID=74940 RepID=UPI000D0A3BE2|nr:chromosome alignment-maintaining phosphoprotein 1 isoform X1 [Oncorhynchus tshawytscha]